jgi:cation transport ATPase
VVAADPRLLRAKRLECDDGPFNAQTAGEPRQTRALVGVDGRLVATLELSDPPREGAREIARGCTRQGSCKWRC